MKDIRNKIITISGEPVSGKSTMVKNLIKKYQELGYQVHVISTGQVFRKIAKAEYLKMYPDKKDVNLSDIQSDETFVAKRNEIDSLVDGEMKQIGNQINSVEKPNDVFIIDSRLAWHNIPTSFAIRLTVGEKIAGRRVFEDTTRGSEDTYQSVEEATEKTRQRKLGEIERYKKRYGVDLTNPENYDLIVDTSFSDSDELAQIIIKGEEAYRAGKYYPKTWASPVHFLPVQDPRQVSYRKPGNGDTIEEITESIKQNGYDPFIGEIDVEECDGVLYIRDGNHRTCAALSAGLTLLPYYAKKVETGEPPVDITSDSYIDKINDWLEGIEYYGGKIGKIEQLKRLNLSDLISIEKIPIARKILKLDEQSGEGR